MKKARIILLLALIALIPFSVGAGRRMSDMSIVCGMGIDCEDGLYTVTLQYLNLYMGSGKSDGITGNITACASGSAESIDKAIKKLQESLSDELFFGQTEVLVIGGNTDKDEIIKYIVSSKYLRNDVMLAEAYGSAKQVIENPQRGSVVPAGSLVKQIKASKSAASINDFLRNGARPLPVVYSYEKYCIVL